MVAQIIGTIAGSLVGGLLGGVSANRAAQKKANAYRDAAEMQKEAAAKYTGQAAYERMVNAGLMGQIDANNRNVDNNANMYGGTEYSNGLNRQWQDKGGFEAGSSKEADILSGEYGKQQAKIQNRLKQADIDYNADAAKTQGIFNAVGTAAKLGSQIGGLDNITSDERAKDFEDADIEDALRQIKSIMYKYKPETGLDQDEHVGVSAQSLLGSAFDDCVKQNDEGLYMLDKQKLQESIMAGIAAVQKEIDELKEKK